MVNVVSLTTNVNGKAVTECRISSKSPGVKTTFQHSKGFSRSRCSRNRYIVITIAMFFVFILPAFQVSAQWNDKEFTTTADFNVGTKGQPSPADGNYGVETITDNPGISANQIELASIKGDSFTLADSDANTWKWDLQSIGATVASRQIINRKSVV